MYRLFRFFFAGLLVLGTHACTTSGGPPSSVRALSVDPVTASSPANTPPELKGDLVPAVVGIPADPGPNQTYRIGPFDLIKIEVFQVAELSSQERVNEEGYVVMPLIGSVKVGGLTPREAEQAIAKQLGVDYLQNPQVNIFVVDYASQKVTVTGRVKKPGVFPVAGKTTLMQAIALAGGLDDVARKDEIVVFRKQPGGDINAYVVNLRSIEEGKLTDPVIVGDDRIVVPKSGAAALGRAIGDVLTGWAIRAPLL